MMRYVPLSALLICTFIAHAACDRKSEQSAGRSSPPSAGPSASPATAAPDGVRRVTIEELRAAQARGEAVIVDVRGPVEYKLGHIAGAISMPLGAVAARGGELPRDKLIVTYCA
jgi:3-mercaptopyruvate sulfurtransferase SseA